MIPLLSDLERLEEMKKYLSTHFELSNGSPNAALYAQAYATVVACIIALKDSNCYKAELYWAKMSREDIAAPRVDQAAPKAPGFAPP